SWTSQGRDGPGSHSFLFSLGDAKKTEFILSKYLSCSGVNCFSASGPNFGGIGRVFGRDLILFGGNFQSNSQSHCKKTPAYSHALLDPHQQVNFDIDDYEVYQVIKPINIATFVIEAIP